jgi:hypothetical protein
MIAAVGLVLVLVATGCGSSKSSTTSVASGTPATTATNSVKLAKTKFVLHAGLAFGVFHHFIYKPLKAGDLKNPLSHKAALVKAGFAAAVVYHEVKLALADAKADPTLSKLVAPLTALEAKLKGLPSSVKNGTVSTSDLNSTNTTIASLKQQAASSGQSITEQVPSSP